VSEVAVRDGLVTCALEGDVGPFLAAIRGAQIRDLTIEPARLEEAFLEYYADEIVAPVVAVNATARDGEPTAAAE
jgi:hypothetical protein